jgi:thioredoxin 1
MRRLMTAGLMTLALLAVSHGSAALGANYGQVSGEMVNVRAGPGVTFDVLTTLKKDDLVEIEATQAGWLSIKWPHDLPVWVAKESLQLQASGEAEQTALVRVAAAVRGVGMRRSEPLCTLDAGARVVVLGELNGWLKIKAPETLHAFISAKFVAASASKPELQGPPAQFAQTRPTPVALLATTTPTAPALAHAPADVVEAPLKMKSEPEPAAAAANRVAPSLVEQEKITAAAVAPPIKCIEEAPAPHGQLAPASSVAAAVSPPELAKPKPLPAVIERPESPAPTTLTAARSFQPEDRYGALQLNDRNFSDVVENKGLAMVDFNAHWCGPCRRMSPVVDALAWDMKEQAVIAKLDVDDASATAGRFGVSRIPCLIIFRDGREIARRYGACSKDDLKYWISTH